MSKQALKAPFPWFGGKSKIAKRVWGLLGNPANYVEPFFGSGATLLLRPDAPKVETVNDLDCYVANFWRATQHDADGVASFADGPVNEADLHGRHRWLVLSDDAQAFRQRMRTDPEFFDARVAGYWCWGLCCWIGGGWCAVPGETAGEVGAEQSRRPVISAPGSQHGRGVNGAGGALSQQIPDQCGAYPGASGKGIHRGGQLPDLSGESGATGRGVHASGMTALRQGRPQLADQFDVGRGVHASPPSDKRPKLSGEFSIGAGIHANDSIGTCAARRAWLLRWFGALRDRFRNVRVCCGDWRRVVASDSVTTRLGTTGVFLDPPYAYQRKGKKVRTKGLYATDSGTVAADVRAWCHERGSDREMRIVLAGYAGEGHESLEGAGWRVESWEAGGGYGNQSGKGKEQARRERLWISPHCVREATLFGED